jgi:cupredoxin-like protein
MRVVLDTLRVAGVPGERGMKLKTIFKTSAGAMLLLASLTAGARADDGGVPVVVADGGFVPTEIQGPPGARFRLDVTNRTAVPIEFESFELNRERVVQPGQTVTVYLSGLTPGRYEFFDDFHQDRRGTLVVK